ncbi:hypothetical protein bcgnr5414_22850 [Bacillus cereus]
MQLHCDAFNEINYVEIKHFGTPLIVSLSSLMIPCAFYISELHALMIFGTMLLVLYEYLR